MSGRTTWWAKDAAWWRRGRIVKLGREFGPAGPAVIDVLMGEAKQQGPSKGHDGSVKADVASLSMCAFIDDDALVQAIVEKAAQIGLLDDFEDLGDGLFTCRMSGWRSDVEMPLAAATKAAQRAGGNPKPARMSPDVPGCPPMSPDVPRDVDVDGDVDGETPTSSLRSDVAAPTATKRQTIRWRGKPIRPDHLDLATAILTAFNARAGTGYRPITRNGKPSEDLSRILGALDDDDRITLPIAGRMIEVAFSRPFWQGRPHTGVVFGPRVASALVEEAVNPAPAGTPNRPSRQSAALAGLLANEQTINERQAA